MEAAGAALARPHERHDYNDRHDHHHLDQHLVPDVASPCALATGRADGYLRAAGYGRDRPRRCPGSGRFGRSAQLGKYPGRCSPSGTTFAVAPVVDRARLVKAVPAGQSYIASFAVFWLVPNGTSPAASAPLTMTIVDPSIRAGDSIFLLTPHGLEAVGGATPAGVVTVKFTTDPAFVVAAVPKVAHLAATVLAKTNAVQVTIGCAPGVACTGSAQLSAKNGRLVLANGTVNVPPGGPLGCAWPTLSRAGITCRLIPPGRSRRRSVSNCSAPRASRPS